MKELCHAKAELLRAYQEASLKYSHAVAKLCHSVGVMPEAEFKYLRLMAERAHKACATAQEALRIHVAEHHC